MNEHVAPSLPRAVCFAAAAGGGPATVPALRSWYLARTSFATPLTSAIVRLSR